MDIYFDNKIFEKYFERIGKLSDIKKSSKYLSFINSFIIEELKISNRLSELCLLYEISSKICSGQIWGLKRLLMEAINASTGTPGAVQFWYRYNIQILWDYTFD